MSYINASNSGFGGIVQQGDSSGILQLQTANTTAVTIDTSQNVGIGTTSPVYKLNVTTASDGVQIFSTNGTIQQAVAYSLSGVSYTGTITNHPSAFLTNNVERMRIDSSGRLLIGTTSIAGTAGANVFIKYSTGTTWQVGPASANTGNTFYVLNSGDVGVALDTGTTSWRTNSDERLKTDLKPIENGINKVTSLRSVTGRFKTDEETVSRAFLIAQDVQNVLPEAISIQDDELGTLGIRYTEVIPLLVAAIKEQQTIITQLQSDITALKAKVGV